MKEFRLVWSVLGCLLILLAPCLGNAAANMYLMLIEGMETNRFLLFIEAFIRSFQIIGVLLTVYGLWKCPEE